jgi:hypothetical protein
LLKKKLDKISRADLRYSTEYTEPPSAIRREASRHRPKSKEKKEKENCPRDPGVLGHWTGDPFPKLPEESIDLASTQASVCMLGSDREHYYYYYTCLPACTAFFLPTQGTIRLPSSSAHDFNRMKGTRAMTEKWLADV